MDQNGFENEYGYADRDSNTESALLRVLAEREDLYNAICDEVELLRKRIAYALFQLDCGYTNEATRALLGLCDEEVY